MCMWKLATITNVVTVMAVALMLTVSHAFAQTPIPITGHLVSATNAPCVTGDCFVRFRLRNYQGTVPRVIGIGAIAKVSVDVAPDNTGAFSTSVWGNDVIQPVNSPATTFYTVEFWSAGRAYFTGNYQFTGAGPFNLDNASPISSTPPPPVSNFALLNPPGSQTMTIPAGASFTFTGGDVFVPTPTNADNSQRAANTSWVRTNAPGLAPVQSVFGRTGAVVATSGDYTVAQVTGAAPIASPTFTGTVTIPSGASIAGYALLASPAFTGAPTAPTQATADATTDLSTDAFVHNAINNPNTIPLASLTGGTNGQCAVNAAGTWSAGSCSGTNTNLFRDFTVHSFTGDTTVHTVASVTVPANSIGVNGGIAVTVVWVETNVTGGDVCSMNVNFGGSFFEGSNAGSTVDWQNVSQKDEILIENRGVANSQLSQAAVISGVNSTTPTHEASTHQSTHTIDTTLSQTLTVTLQNSVTTGVCEIDSIEMHYF